MCVFLDTEVTIFPTFTGAGHKSICPGNVVYCVFWRMVEAHHRHIHKIIGFLIISFMTGGSSARRQSGPGEGREEICQNIKDNTLIFRPGKVLIWIFNSTLNVKLLFSILILHPIYVKLQPTHILTAVLTLSYFHLLLC